MIISYPASPSRIIVLLKALRHIIENLKKKVKEMNAASEKTERKKSFSIKSYKQKGRENLSMCCSVSGQLNEFNETSREKRKGFTFEKIAEFIGSEPLLMVGSLVKIISIFA